MLRNHSDTQVKKVDKKVDRSKKSTKVSDFFQPPLPKRFRDQPKLKLANKLKFHKII